LKRERRVAARIWRGNRGTEGKEGAGIDGNACEKERKVELNEAR